MFIVFFSSVNIKYWIYLCRNIWYVYLTAPVKFAKVYHCSQQILQLKLKWGNNISLFEKVKEKT